MNRSVDHLIAGFVAAILTGVVAGVVIWRITATQHEFVAGQFAAQNAKIQAVGEELAKTARDLKRLGGALKTTNDTLAGVKDQVSLVGTRNGIARLNTLVEAANKTLAEIKQATAPEQARAALAPLADKLDSASKALAALQTKSDDKTRDQALARIETAIAGVKDAIAKRPPDPALAQANAKLDDALKALADLSKAAGGLKGGAEADAAKLDAASKTLADIDETLAALKSDVGANAAKLADASKSLATLDTSVKQGFADTAAKQAELAKAVEKPAPAPQPATAQPAAKPEQDLVVFYVSMAGQAAAAPAPPPKGEPGLTPTVPPPFTVHFEQLGKVDDEGQTKLIVGKVRALIKGHSGCAIAVAGHTDTFGGDRKNYELSRRRANEVADKLKAAFKAESIPVTETQWGERRLEEWTPDGTAREANRRVDIRVSCEK